MDPLRLGRSPTARSYLEGSRKAALTSGSPARRGRSHPVCWPTTVIDTGVACSIHANASSSTPSALSGASMCAWSPGFAPRPSGSTCRSASPAPIGTRRSRIVASPRVSVTCTLCATGAKFTISRYASPAFAVASDGRTSNAVTPTFAAASKTEWTTIPAGSSRAIAPSVMKWTVSAPASCGHAVTSPPAGAMWSRADSISLRSVVGPSTRPSAVVASAIGFPDSAAASLRACATARSHRDSWVRVRVDMDQDESMMMSTRPRDAEGVADRSEGRIAARASASAMATVSTSETARRIRSHNVTSRGSSSTRCQSSRDATSIRGGRSLRRNSHAASAATPPRSSHASAARMAPNVMRENAPGGTP